MKRVGAPVVALAVVALLPVWPNAARANPGPGPVDRAPAVAQLIARDGPRLGADPGVEYSKEYVAGEPADAIAAELIGVLHDAYAYRGTPPLTLDAETQR